MARNGPEEQRKADANRAAKKARQDRQRARDEQRQAETEKERRRLEANRLAGRAGVKSNGRKRGT